MPSESYVEDSHAKEHFQFESDNLLALCEMVQETQVEDHTEGLLEIRMKDLESRWQELEKAYRAAILSKDVSITPELRNDIKNRHKACTDAYHNCYAQMQELLKMQRVDNPSNPQFQSTARYSLQPQQATHALSSNDSCDYIKLPPCDTEVFKGSYEQWPSFRDMFTALYINHSKLSPVTKLYHLRSKTKGEAGAIVKRYTLSHENFELAWTALKERYENKRVLVDNQIKILFDIPAAKSEDSESLRRI